MKHGPLRARGRRVMRRVHGMGKTMRVPDSGQKQTASEKEAPRIQPHEDSSIPRDNNQSHHGPQDHAETGAPSQGTEDGMPQMSLREHLLELRTRLVRCLAILAVAFVGVFVAAPRIRSFVTGYVREFIPAGGDVTFAQLTEPFLVDMHLAFVLGFFVASPLLFYQMWAFVAPGLYASERRHIVPLALASAFFFLAGGAFCTLVVLPLTYSFFIAYGQDSARPMLTLASTYKFSLRLILGFGFVFEMPLVSFFLTKLRIITAARLRAWRKYAVLGNFIIAAVITPPDVLSQLLLAGPLLLLYELSILVSAAAGPSGKASPVPAS